VKALVIDERAIAGEAVVDQHPPVLDALEPGMQA